MSDEDRCYYDEAVMILAGESMMHPERAHLEALVEHHECQKIKQAMALDALKVQFLRGMP